MNKEEQFRKIIDELIVKGNTEIIPEAFAADYKAYAGEKEHSGQAFLKRFTNQLRKSFPDIKLIDIKILLEKDELVTWQRSFSGTNKVAMQGIPASNKNVIWTEMLTTKFKDGKISEEWLVSELMGELLLRVPKK